MKKWVIPLIVVITIMVIGYGLYLFFRPAPTSVELPQAKFQIRNLTIAPSKVLCGEDVTISVNVKNVGDKSGTKTLEFKIDGKLKTRSITLGPGESTKISISVTEHKEGNFDVSVFGMSNSFEVRAPENVPENAPENAPENVPAENAPENAPEKEKVIIFDSFSDSYDYTKLSSYAFIEDLRVELVKSSRELKNKLRSGEYPGVWCMPCYKMGDATIFELSRFVRNGGRVFFDIYHTHMVDSFEDYFNISIASEKIATNRIYNPGGNFTTLWEGLVVGIEGKTYWHIFFVPKKGLYKTNKIKSQSTGLQRVVSAYGKFGKGEALFIVGTCSVFGDEPIAHDYSIDDYNNKTASMRILEWLAGKRRY